MSDKPTLTAAVLRPLGAYVMHRDATKDEMAALRSVFAKVRASVNPETWAELAKVIGSGREVHQRLAAMESASALIARALVQLRMEGMSNIDRKAAARWVSANVTASEAHVGRARAIWRHMADLGFGTDSAVYTHAIKSAVQGSTLRPAPTPEITDTPAPSGEQPTSDAPEDTTPPSETGSTNPPPKTGKEDKMIDPTKIRKPILEKFAFNMSGLPKALRDENKQKVYLDAIVTAVAALGREPHEGLNEAGTWSVATAGLMLLDGHYNPQDSRFFAHVQKAVEELSSPVVEGAQVQIDGHRVRDGQLLISQTEKEAGETSKPLMMNAPSEEKQRISMFVLAEKIIRTEGNRGGKIFLQSLAAAGRKAVDTYSDHEGDLDQAAPTVTSAYDDAIVVTGSGGGGSGVANVELPPLNDPAGYNDEIVRENVQAVSTIYVSYQLEFAIKACARVLELFVAGLLPIPASDGSARILDNLYWDQDDLLDEASRRSIYARVLGAPGGELSFDVQPNSEFNTLLMRSVSAISEYEREQSALTHFDNAARGRRFQTTSGEFVRKAIRDFAANVSLRGWAGTAFTAERMATQITQVMKVLGLPAVRNALGVTTPWQVIERISQREFGITVNTVLHRTLAVETQKIMGIIAENHGVWSNTAGGTQLFSETDANEGDLNLTDSRALVVAAQHFRAVTGIGDGLMNEYSEPVETYAQPSLPDIGSIGGAGGGMPQINMDGINELRNLVNTGQTPSPDQILSMLPRI